MSDYRISLKEAFYKIKDLRGDRKDWIAVTAFLNVCKEQLPALMAAGKRTDRAETNLGIALDLIQVVVDNKEETTGVGGLGCYGIPFADIDALIGVLKSNSAPKKTTRHNRKGKGAQMFFKLVNAFIDNMKWKRTARQLGAETVVLNKELKAERAKVVRLELAAAERIDKCLH